MPEQVVARYDLFEPISEADLVDLFQEDKFPLDAAAFIEKLPLRTTDGLIGRQYLEQESNKDSLGSQVCVLGGGNVRQHNAVFILFLEVF